MIYKNNGFWIS